MGFLKKLAVWGGIWLVIFLGATIFQAWHLATQGYTWYPDPSLMESWGVWAYSLDVAAIVLLGWLGWRARKNHLAKRSNEGPRP